MTSHINGNPIVCYTACSSQQQIKHQSSALPVLCKNSLTRAVIWKALPHYDVIMGHYIKHRTSKFKTLARGFHDDTIKWKHFPRYWFFMRGIHRWPVDYPSRRPVTRSFDVFFDLHLNKGLSKQSRRWWFEKPIALIMTHYDFINTFVSSHYLKQWTY